VTEAAGPLYSWLTNNKWKTNFKVTCGGRYEFRYIIEAGKHLAEADAAMDACRANAIPLLTVRR